MLKRIGKLFCTLLSYLSPFSDKDDYEASPLLMDFVDSAETNPEQIQIKVFHTDENFSRLLLLPPRYAHTMFILPEFYVTEVVCLETGMIVKHDCSNSSIRKRGADLLFNFTKSAYLTHHKIEELDDPHEYSPLQLEWNWDLSSDYETFMLSIVDGVRSSKDRYLKWSMKFDAAVWKMRTIPQTEGGLEETRFFSLDSDRPVFYSFHKGVLCQTHLSVKDSNPQPAVIDVALLNSNFVVLENFAPFYKLVKG